MSPANHSPTIRPAGELRPSRRLLELLPGIYRQRDAAVAYDAKTAPPLAQLIGVIGGGLDELFDAIDALWDDHFVERAQAAALPLLAELFGVRLLSIDPQAQRALIARIVGWRRRKGTLVTLEDVLSDTTTWDAEVDEGFRSVIATLDFAHLAPWRGRTAIIWDPIGLADPLTRRAASPSRPRNDERRDRGQVLAPLPGESIDETLRRLGRVDAGMYAASPRVLDLRGWARPDAVLIRSEKLVAVELEDVEPMALRPLPHDQRGGWIDPAGRDTPLVWLHPVDRPDLDGGLTARHEPAPPDLTPPRLAAGLLTPTALAEDPDRAEAAGAFQLAIDGVVLVGPPAPELPRGALVAASVGDDGVVRFAEAGRPSPGDLWRLTVIAALPEVDDPTLTDRVQLQATVGPAGVVGGVIVAPDAGEDIAGRSIDLVIERLAGEARQRTAGAWSTLALDPAHRSAASNAALVDVGGATWIARIERAATGGNQLVRAALGSPGWTDVRALPAPLDLADGIALIGDAGALYAVAGDPIQLGAWAIRDLAGAVTVTRIDTASPRTPIGRASPSLAITGGRLYVFGGDDEGAAAGDLWSIATAGSAWRPHPLRRAQGRIGGALIATPAGLVLVGGDAISGTLATDVRIWDPAGGRAWRPLPALPVPAGPGFVVAHATSAPDGIEVIAWADRIRPLRLFLATGVDNWDVGAIEPLGPNPPAIGEAVFHGSDLLVIGPAPLPSSDVVFTQGDHGILAVLPRLALGAGDNVRLRVASDGSTFRRDPPTAAEQARPRPLDTRFGGLLADDAMAAPPSNNRYAQPGRLARVPWRLAQRSLGPWDSLIAPSADPRNSDDGELYLDPRLGRFVLPTAAPDGRVTVSCRIGRGGALGPGLVPPGRTIPLAWREPDPAFAVADPPDLDIQPARTIELDPHAYVAPHRAGQRTGGPDGALIDITGSLEAAVAAVPDGTLGRIAILGSARVPFARLTAGVDTGVSIVAADPGSTPIVDRDVDRDLSLLLQSTADDAPSYWLAGLWLLGRLELAIEHGTVDLRYCQLAGPGRVGLWAPGAGHQELAARRSLPRPELEIRLYGCQVGTIELPPWARLVAAGCTFDAGARDATAIRAAGAWLRLRHSTIHGAVEAGRLEASSCVFAGDVRVDRADLGFVRHSVYPRTWSGTSGGGTTYAGPRPFASLAQTASFVSIDATSPGYLVLAANNSAGVFAAGEGASQPGAYGERGDHERELDYRTREFLPIGMDPVHVDRTTFDLYRMGRR